MAEFVGENSSKLDDKGRLIFPAEFRAQAAPFAGSRYVVRKNLYDNSLEMFQTEEWEKYAEQVKSRINLFSREGNRVWEEFNRGRALIEPDEKTGRMLIPKQLLEKIKVQKEVVFVGMGFKVQIWAKETWESRAMSDEEAGDLFEKLLG